MTRNQGSGVQGQGSESGAYPWSVVRGPSSIVHRLSSIIRRHWDALAFFAASLILYAATAAPSVATVFDDSLEFHVVLPNLGIAHPSGYPLYTILGWLFTHLLPFRDPAGRANLLSALLAAATVALLYLVARRFAGSRPAAAVATIAFAISPAWWSQATIAEVYALHGLLMILFICLLVRWEILVDADFRRSPQINQQVIRVHPRPSASALVAAAFVFGLGMAHHRMIALLLPAALVFVFWTDPSLLRQPRRWVVPILAGLAPMLLYLYLPIRGRAVTSLDGTFVSTLTETLNWIAARAYGIFLTGNPFGVQRNATSFASLFIEQFSVLLLLAALLGLANGWRYAVRRYVFLLLATATTVAFGLAYKVQDIAVLMIPAFTLTTLWIAMGLGPIFDATQIYAAHTGRALRLPRRTRPLVLGSAAVLIAALILVEPVSAALGNFAKRDQSRSWGVYDYGQDMLANVTDGGQVVGLLGETTLLRYFRDVLGQRADVTVVPADREADRFAAVDAALAAGIPVYLTRDLPGAASRYSLDAAGPLIAISPKATPTQAPPGQPMGAGVVLANAQIQMRQTHAGPVVRVTPTWVATAPIKEQLKVSARLLNAAGKQVVQDDRIPVHFAYPTTAWIPGEPVQDNYDLALPPGASSGPYTVLLILYRAADGGEVGRMETQELEVRR